MAFDGSDATVSRIVREYSPMLLRLACSRLENMSDAEDAVQDVFLKLLTTQPVFRNAEHEKAWLIRATLHRAADLRRKAERKNVPLDAVAEIPAPELESKMLLSAVRSLPERYGAVIHLYYYEGYSIKDIGKMLGIPSATAGVRLARGRARLRQMLKEEMT